MTRQALLQELKKTAPPHLKECSSLVKAIELLETIDGKVPLGLNEKIFRLAERIYIHNLKEKDNLYILSDGNDIKPQDLVAGDYLLAQITSWIYQVREELFGAPEPPFERDIQGAVSWLESTAKFDLEKNRDIDNISSPNTRQVQSSETPSSFLRREIRIPDKKGIKHLWAQPGTLLYKLSRRIQMLSDATGFKLHTVTIFLLTGLEPILPRITLSVQLGRAVLPKTDDENCKKGVKPKRVVKRSLRIDINSADISPQELKKIYDSYRNELNVRKSKTLSSEQIQLFYLVYGKGGPPAEGSKAFWQEIKSAWNANPANKPYKSWEGVYQRYRIIESKMEQLFFRHSDT